MVISMKVTLKSFINEVSRDLEAAEGKVRTKAAQHLVKKMKAKVSDVYFKGFHSQAGEPPGKISGDLRKGIGYLNEKAQHQTKVGVGPPAYYAHMLEFGTAERFVSTKGGKKRSVGRVLPRPFVYPTFEQEADAVKDILSEKWV